MNRLVEVQDGGAQRIGELKDAMEALQTIMHRFAELMYKTGGRCGPWD